jgi:hypothetical protein
VEALKRSTQAKILKGVNMLKQNTVIFDLDGTLANIDARRVKAGKTKDGKVTNKMDWDVFFDPINVLTLDLPNDPVIKMAQLFKKDGFQIVIFSGRNDRSFATTKQWLKQNDVPFDLLVMRPDKFKSDSWPIADGNPATGDMRFMPDEILKKKMLDTFVDIKDVFLVVDDRDKVVKMWRDLGLNTFQVAPGDF